MMKTVTGAAHQVSRRRVSPKERRCGRTGSGVDAISESGQRAAQMESARCDVARLAFHFWCASAWMARAGGRTSVGDSANGLGRPLSAKNSHQPKLRGCLELQSL